MIYVIVRDRYREQIRRRALAKIRKGFDKPVQSPANEENETVPTEFNFNSSPQIIPFNEQILNDVDTDTYEVVSSERSEQNPFHTNSNLVNIATGSKRQKLAAWAVFYKQPREAVNSLLSILREDDHTLPKDHRTLCQVPKEYSKQIIEMNGGKYVHFGFTASLKQLLSNVDVTVSALWFDINIDGVPISKSSNCCLWPVLINVVGFKAILLVGIYFGYEKPHAINEYMEPFVTEYLELCSKGLKVEQKMFTVHLRCVVADAPARAFFLNIKSHSGYYSCHKCKIPGEYSSKKVCFPGVQNELRSDEEFSEKNDGNHHKDSESLIFEKIPGFGGVTSVIVDYMHAVLLGVTKKLLHLWTKEKKCLYSLRNQQVMNMSERINIIGRQLPHEFSRKPRGLECLPRYKATELRQLILYTLPVIAKGILKTEYYSHFMQFHCAIKILCTQETCIDYNHVADSLLTAFVKRFPKLYQKHNVKFNVHSLLHLSSDVKYTQKPLDSFSAFKFENYLQILKKDARNCVHVLEQIVNRSAERSKFEQYFPYIQTYPPSDFEKKNQLLNLKYIVIRDAKYTTKEPNNLIHISNEKIIVKIIKLTRTTKDTVILEGQQILKVKPFYNKPVPSHLLGIYKVNGIISFGPIKEFEFYKNDIKKVAKFKVENIHYLFTLMH